MISIPSYSGFGSKYFCPKGELHNSQSIYIRLKMASCSPPPPPGAMIPVFILFLLFHSFLCLHAFLLSDHSIAVVDHSSSSYRTNKSSIDYIIAGRSRLRRPPPPSPPPSPPPPPPSPPPPPPPPFEYYILELIWPPSFCKRLNHPPCRNPVLQRWTIHGLWPQGSEYCDPDDKLKPGEISKLLPQLSVEWPSLTRTSDGEFWGKQWLKHGTCSGLGQREYFDLTLRLLNTKIGSVRTDLGKAGCNPGDQKCNPSLATTKYPGSNNKPRIKCYDKTSSPHVELMGVIQFKFYKNETQDNMVEPTNCTSTLVEYPLKHTSTQLIG